MDVAGDRIPQLTAPSCIDLHLHSTASDGECPPAQVVARAAELGLSAVALTDHDSVSGVPEAVCEGRTRNVRVIGGCEFSVAAPWGEMHLLGYFLDPDSPGLEEFLALTRTRRKTRAEEIVHRLNGLGVAITMDQVLAEAGTGAIGRPHVGRALIRMGAARSLNNAFERYIGRGRPGFVPKQLPPFQEVCTRIREAGGISSAAHLKDRGTRSCLQRFKEAGLDAVETRHPSHDPDVRATLTQLALEVGLLRTGGSDWHGDGLAGESHGPMGSQDVPFEWLGALEARARERQST